MSSQLKTFTLKSLKILMVSVNSPKEDLSLKSHN